MALVYATIADLVAAGMTVDPDDPVATRRIVVASRWVRHATRAAIYDVTPTGAPSDEAIADVFRDAVVEQVIAWDAAGVDPDAGAGVAVGKVVSSKSLRGASVTYAAADTVAADRERAATTLAPGAYATLAEAGLVGGPLWTI